MSLSKIWIVVGTLAGLLGACGGGGGGGGDNSSSDSTNTNTNTNAPTEVALNTLSGSIVKGPVDGATVCAFELLASGKGNKIGCTTSRADGSYSFDLAYSGQVVIEAAGGHYTDEATGQDVTLSTPLTTVGRLSSGSNTLMATPLTSLAYHQSVSGGNLSVSGYEAAARSVKTTFGLGDEVDLARTLPTVTPGQINSYGQALVGVSKMIKGGASLTGLLASQNLPELGSNYQVCSAPEVDASVDIQVALSVDVPVSASPTLIEVTGPYAPWRATLPVSGPVNQSACQVLENTATKVRLSCEQTASGATVKIVAGSFANRFGFAAQPNSDATPAFAGAKIVFSGGDMRLNALAPVYIDGGNGTVKVNIINSGGKDIAIIGGVAPVVCQLQASGTLSPGNIAIATTGFLNTATTGDAVTTAGNLSLGGGASSISLSPGSAAGTVSTSGGGLTVPNSIVTQNTQSQIINWNNFTISEADAANFVQPTGKVAFGYQGVFIKGSSTPSIKGQLTSNSVFFSVGVFGSNVSSGVTVSGLNINSSGAGNLTIDGSAASSIGLTISPATLNPTLISAK